MSKGLTESGAHQAFLSEDDLAAVTEEKEIHAFEIDPAQVSTIIL